MSGQVGAEMPKYRCHKVVHALKIQAVTSGLGVVGPRIVPADEGFSPFEVSSEWIERFKPEAGGYYVIYEDGYKSFSPAKAFEDGYTRI
jgi:hypothetical protein